MLRQLESDPGDRLGEYWRVGMNLNTPEAGWTRKDDGRGNDFPPEEDGRYAWSAAFICYAMTIPCRWPGHRRRTARHPQQTSTARVGGPRDLPLSFRGQIPDPLDLVELISSPLRS